MHATTRSRAVAALCPRKKYRESMGIIPFPNVTQVRSNCPPPRRCQRARDFCLLHSATDLATVKQPAADETPLVVASTIAAGCWGVRRAPRSRAARQLEEAKSSAAVDTRASWTSTLTSGVKSRTGLAQPAAPGPMAHRRATRTCGLPHDTPAELSPADAPAAGKRTVAVPSGKSVRAGRVASESVTARSAAAD